MNITELHEKPDVLLGEVEWSQTVQVRDYEPARATVRLGFLFDPDDPESQIAGIRDAMFTAKSTIFEQFGKTFEIKDGVAVELVRDGFDAQVVEFVPSEPSAGVGPNPPHDPAKLTRPKRDMTDNEKNQARENQEWAEARLRTHPHEFYDNRGDKSSGKVHPKLPDFKHKDTKIGVWVDS